MSQKRHKLTPKTPHYTTWGYKPSRLESACFWLLFVLAEGLTLIWLIGYIIEIMKGN